jgi:uncharacterized membrane protein HdeD (DUF308 family)
MSLAHDALQYEMVEEARRWWWVPLITGILWILISLVFFRFDARSATAVGILAGVVFIVTGIEELVLAFSVDGGWRWLWLIFGILLIVGGVVALAHPVNTFVALASLVGWLLAIKGIFDIVLGLTNRELDLWWLRLVLGIVELGLAVVVSGDFTNKAIFLVAFVAAWSLVKGITNIILAFQLRRGVLPPDRTLAV